MEQEAFITVGLVALTFAALAGWFLMSRRPSQWAKMVERDNNYWRDKGWISPTFAEKLKGLETSQVLKSLCLITACVGIVGVAMTISVWVKVVKLRHQRLRPPYNPALYIKPQKQPAAAPKPKH